ncbi:MAG: arginase family protein [Bacteroidota bacterium]|nr:arginase family protein [Bacteroidota bacterium]
MNIHDYLESFEKKNPFSDNQFLSRHISFLQKGQGIPKDSSFKVAIIGVPDDKEVHTFESARQIRENLYNLAALTAKLTIIDLGNIKTGNSFTDTCFALCEIITTLNADGTLVVLLGSSSAFNIGNIMAYRQSDSLINMAVIDSTISKEEIPPFVLTKDNLFPGTETFKLFNYINIAYQSYFVERETLDFIEDSNYEAYRVGYVRANIKEMEPVLRDADLVSFSLNSLKHSDAPGVNRSSPNGLSSEEACQLAFYAGHSNRVKSFNVWDLAPDKDIHQTTSKLAAQIIWYFFEGLSNAIPEEPQSNTEHFIKYLIHLNQTDQDIAFFKSNLTNRWWMEITLAQSNQNITLSCSPNDYELACQQDIPDRWWRTFQRFSH